MSASSEAAEQFRGIADLLDLLGERFKPEAYRRAARSLDALPGDLREMSARDELRSVPGVGDAIAEKIREFLSTGRIDYYDRLRREVPAGLVELMRLPGIGPKTARRLWTDLGVDGPAGLHGVIDSGRLVELKGFGPRKVEQIRAALEAAGTGSVGARRPIEDVVPLARRLHAALAAAVRADRVEIAGSFRRGRETVGDLDILVSTDSPGPVFDAFSALPEVQDVRMRGPTKETVVLKDGLQADLRVVEPAAFGAALQYFTGSKDHNVQLRSLARERGLKVNEYGVFRGEERIAGRTEEEVYSALGLSWIPPELREGGQEIAESQSGALPRLVEERDLTAELHLHLPPSARRQDLKRLRTQAQTRSLRYVGVVVATQEVDGSRVELPPDVRNGLREGSRGSVRFAPVVEVGPGALDIGPEDTDIEYAVLRAGPGPPPTVRTRIPVRLVAHVGGPPSSIEPWIRFARSAGAALEVGPGADRLDSASARAAREAGIPLAVPTGLGAPPDDAVAEVALRFARRAGATRAEVANAARPSTAKTERR